MRYLLLLLILLLSPTVLAQPAQLVAVPLKDGATLSPDQLKPILTRVNALKPRHIVVLLHGYGVIKEDCDKAYAQVAERVVQGLGPRTAVLGVQWESAVPGSEWPWETEGAYFQMLSRARGVGGAGLRQLLLETQKANPQARTEILSHSLGCEVACAALYPGLNYHDDGTPSLSPYQPKGRVNASFWGLLGSDLDYDVWKKTGVDLSGQQPVMYMTIASYTGDRDHALMMRKMSRGFAGGTALPLMTQTQYDTVFKKRRILFDGRDLDRKHDFTEYLSDTRLQRMLPIVRYLADASQPKPKEITDADRILALPPRADAIRPWLDSGELTPQLYALWRLEQVNCGGSQHFSDQTIENTARLLRSQPAKVRAERPDSPCLSIKKGYWPTEKQMTAAGAPNW